MKTISREEFEKRNVFGTGAENTGFAQYFIGNSYLNPLTDPKNCAVFMANVTFEPGCRNNWHHSPRSKRRWTAFDLHSRRGMVSGRMEKRHLKNDFSFFKCLFWNHRLLIRCKRYGCYRG